MSQSISLCRTDARQILSSYENLVCFFKNRGDERIREIKDRVFQKADDLWSLREFSEKYDMRKKNLAAANPSGIFSSEQHEETHSEDMAIEMRRFSNQELDVLIREVMFSLDLSEKQEFNVLISRLPKNLIFEFLTYVRQRMSNQISMSLLINKFLRTGLPAKFLFRVLEAGTDVLTMYELLEVTLPKRSLKKMMGWHLPNKIFARLILDLPQSVQELPSVLDKVRLFPRGFLVKVLRLKNLDAIFAIIDAEDLTIMKELYEQYYVEEITRRQALLKLRVCSSENKLAPTQDADLQYHAPIKIRDLADHRVRNRTLESYENITITDPDERVKIIFKEKAGTCRGCSFWFIHLYLSVQHLFAGNPLAAVLAVGRQFAQGAENESILLQSLYNVKKGKMLNLRIETQEEAYFVRAKQIYNDEPPNIYSNLQRGVYKLDLDLHACVLIKPDEDPNGLLYYFDPNYGVFELSGEYRDFLLQALLKWYFPKDCRNHLNFRLCSLRNPAELHNCDLPEVRVAKRARGSNAVV